MKEDSLLSSLSNVSYYHNNQNSDFFSDSAPAGGYPQLKINPPKQQQEFNLNFLPIFHPNELSSPKQNGFLTAAYWTLSNHLLQGNSENGSECEEENPHVQPDATKDPQPKRQIMLKVEEPDESQDSSSDDQIGTVIKNQTKNIPKNYGKAIITYIEKERQNIEQVLKDNGVEYDQLLNQLSKKKKFINTIANLRDLWLEFKYAKCMRVLSNQFLRKYALQYIFNSRICNYTSHVKYRKRLQEAIETPGSFRHIKQY